MFDEFLEYLYVTGQLDDSLKNEEINDENKSIVDNNSESKKEKNNDSFSRIRKK